MEQVILRSNEGFADRVEPGAGVEKSVQGDVGQICKRPTHDDGLEGRRRRGRREVSEEGSGHARKLVRAASKSAGRGRRGTRCRIEQETRTRSPAGRRRRAEAVLQVQAGEVYGDVCPLKTYAPGFLVRKDAWDLKLARSHAHGMAKTQFPHKKHR